jgi:hypothetical protein
MKGVVSLAVDPDGSLLLWRNSGKKDIDDMSVYALQRCSLEGEPLPLWPRARTPGQRFHDLRADWSVPDWFHLLKNRFQTCRDGNVTISSDREGSLCLVHHDRLACFDRQGRKRHAIELPSSVLPGRACSDGKGNTLLLVSGARETTRILRVSPAGAVSVFSDHVTRGGACGSEQLLAVAPDGTLYATGYGGRLRVFSGEGALCYAGAVSLEEEKQALASAGREAE